MTGLTTALTSERRKILGTAVAYERHGLSRESWFGLPSATCSPVD